MNIIIPLAGKGERFSKNGYTEPKPLIKIFEKKMIEYVLDNLTISENDKIFIIYNRYLNKYDFSKYIINKYSFVNFIQVNDTKGAVETLFLGIEYIFSNYDYHKKCLILDCDTFYTEDIRNIFNNSNENMVFYTKNYDINAIYSYIELNDNLIITNIKEKEKISDNANTGAYAFTDINILYEKCKYVLDNKITFNNEPYTSCVISEMIKTNFIFKGYELKEEYVFSLGTPTSVKKYIENTYAFLFDLDGTLVITDEIYFDVWYEILLKYNILLTKEIFSNIIQGNNDKYVISVLLKNLVVDLNELSNLKDMLFIKNIHKIKIVEGVHDIFHQIKMTGHKMCIVTNCNRNVVNEIIKYIGINKYIDFIISNNDCINSKPDPEPYMKAMQTYGIDNYKCFIFEDSKSGILSGKSINPNLLIGIETIYSKTEFINFGVNLSIKNYLNFNINNLIHNESNDSILITKYLKELIITNSSILNVKEILIDHAALKGGFIADVIGFKTITCNKIFYQILKYEKKEQNNLSIMAKKMELYQREYYFYTNISENINLNCKLKIPKFYNIITEKNGHNSGIVLENLIHKGYKLNLNLNIESIDITLKIIDRMAQLHSVFWNKNLKKMYPELKTTNDNIFRPFFTNFIEERNELFKNKWFKILNSNQQKKYDEIYRNFDQIQYNFSIGNNLTFIHGDIKSPNIFYDIDNNSEPYFIDWQHCGIGKGVQDLVFFILESFDIVNIKSIFILAKQYYYKKIIEYGITSYSYEEYNSDLNDAICYIPFFTSVWFGTIPQDELIDKNFPYFLISKLFYLLD